MKTGGGGKWMGVGEARFQGFRVSRFPGFQGFGASRFRGFKVSGFQGFGVSRSGVWSRRSTDQDGSARILGVSELRGWLMIVFGDGGGDVSHEVVMDFLGIGAVDEDADAAGGDVDGVDAEDFTAADRDVKA